MGGMGVGGKVAATMSKINFRDFPKICRLCLAKSKTLICIFLNEYGTSFEEKIFEHTTVIVSEIDGLPTQICKKCLAFLTAAATFRKKTCDSDKLLRHVLNAHRAPDENSFPIQNDENELSSYGKIERSYDPTDVDVKDLSVQDDPLDIVTKLEALRETYTLIETDCLADSVPPDPLSDIKDNQASSFQIIVPESSESILPESQYEPTMADDTFGGNLQQNIKALMSVAGQPAAVEAVDVFEYSDEDVELIESIPPVPLLGPSRDCLEQSTNLSFLCDVCGELFATAAELRDHRRFIGHERFACAGCGQRFQFKRTLAAHLAKKHPAPSKQAGRTDRVAKEQAVLAKVPEQQTVQAEQVPEESGVQAIQMPEGQAVLDKQALAEQLEVAKEAAAVRQPANQCEASASTLEGQPKQQCNLCGRQACRTAACTIQVEACVACVSGSQPTATRVAFNGAQRFLCHMCGQMQAGTQQCTLVVQACRRCILKAKGEDLAAKGEEPAAKGEEPAPKKRGRKKKQPDIKMLNPGAKAPSVPEELGSSASESLDVPPLAVLADPGEPTPPRLAWSLLTEDGTLRTRLRSGKSTADLRGPRLSCSVCGAEFPSTGQLLAHCIDTLHNRLVCEDCGPDVNFATEARLANHRHSQHSPSLCSVCKQVFPGRAELREHRLETMHGLFPCPTCNDRVDHGSAVKLRAHTRLKHKVAMQCPHCSKTMKTRRCMKAHIQMHKYFTIIGGEFTCNVCQRVVSKMMQWHLEMEHEIIVDSSTPTGLCAQCGATVALAQLPTHVELHKHFTGNGDLRVCNVCNDGVRRLTLMRHLTDHGVYLETQDLLYCAECGDGFSGKVALIGHLEGKHTQGSTRCVECDLEFPTLRDMHLHKKAKHWKKRGPFEKPHACHVCQKKFRTREYVKKHLLSHTGEKPHVCQICERAFSLRPNLLAHMRQHTSELPYKCVVCGKGFKHNVSRKNHMKYHSEMPPVAAPRQKPAKRKAVSGSEQSSKSEDSGDL